MQPSAIDFSFEFLTTYLCWRAHYLLPYRISLQSLTPFISDFILTAAAAWNHASLPIDKYYNLIDILFHFHTWFIGTFRNHTTIRFEGSLIYKKNPSTTDKIWHLMSWWTDIQMALKWVNVNICGQWAGGLWKLPVYIASLWDVCCRLGIGNGNILRNF